jgi:hypothetical protein
MRPLQLDLSISSPQTEDTVLHNVLLLNMDNLFRCWLYRNVSSNPSLPILPPEIWRRIFHNIFLSAKRLKDKHISVVQIPSTKDGFLCFRRVNYPKRYAAKYSDGQDDVMQFENWLKDAYVTVEDKGWPGILALHEDSEDSEDSEEDSEDSEEDSEKDWGRTPVYAISKDDMDAWRTLVAVEDAADTIGSNSKDGNALINYRSALLYTNIKMPDVLSRLCSGFCKFCRGSRTICPGCTGGYAQNFDAFMGCGVDLACPLCLGYRFCQKDKAVLQDYYWDSMPMEAFLARQKSWDDRLTELGYKLITFEREPEEEEGVDVTAENN